MSHRSLWAVAALSVALTVRPTAAAERTLRIDPTKTRVEFLVVSTLHDVEGTFAVRGGEVRFDPATGTAAGEITLDLASGATGNRFRDRTMRQEVLETARYPLAVFRPEKVAGELAASGRSRLELAGSLDIHGATRSVTIPVTAEVSGSSLRATGELTIPFVEWGLHDPSGILLSVAKTVRVTLTVVGELSADG